MKGWTNMLPNELDFNSYKLSTRIWLLPYKLTGRKARNALEKACEMMWEVEAEQTRGLADVMALHEQTFGLVDDIIVDVANGCSAGGFVDEVAKVARGVSQC